MDILWTEGARAEWTLMSEMPFPRFEAPPVNEVVLGVSFRPVSDLRTVELVELWQSAYRDEFPVVEEHPPYEPPIELFDRPPVGPWIRFDVAQDAVSPRLWLLDADRSAVVQLQRDWFAVNWRRAAPDARYSQYDTVRRMFKERLDQFQAFLRDHDAGDIAPRQCEVTYVNRIEPNEVWKSPGEIAEVLRLAGRSGGEFLQSLESLQISATALIRANDDTHIGRLHINALPAFAEEESHPVIVLSLTARGRPLGEGVDGVLSFLDVGHEWVVKSFVDITTEDMHRIWGRRG